MSAISLRIFVASPFRGTTPAEREANVAWARDACRYVIAAGHAPFAPHLLYPQFLDEDDPAGREAGMAAGRAFLEVCDELWAFLRPVESPTPGMESEAKEARRLGKPVRVVTKAEVVRAAEVAEGKNG